MTRQEHNLGSSPPVSWVEAQKGEDLKIWAELNKGDSDRLLLDGNPVTILFAIIPPSGKEIFVKVHVCINKDAEVGSRIYRVGYAKVLIKEVNEKEGLAVIEKTDSPPVLDVG